MLPGYDQSEHETHPTVKRMEQVANELFRNADTQEGPQSDIEPKRVSWRERVKAWFASIKQAISK